MTTAMLDIIVKAVKIRLSRGEDITSILLSYPKLSDEDRAYIRGKIT
jgi:hypothetical protein